MCNNGSVSYFIYRSHNIDHNNYKKTTIAKIPKGFNKLELTIEAIQPSLFFLPLKNPMAAKYINGKISQCRKPFKLKQIDIIELWQ